MMTFEELKKTIAEIKADGPIVAGLLVSPDVFAAMQAQIAKVDELSSIGRISVTVNRSLPKGSMVPVDKDGRPLLKPAKAS